VFLLRSIHVAVHPDRRYLRTLHDYSQQVTWVSNQPCRRCRPGAFKHSASNLEKVIVSTFVALITTLRSTSGISEDWLVWQSGCGATFASNREIAQDGTSGPISVPEMVLYINCPKPNKMAEPLLVEKGIPPFPRNCSLRYRRTAEEQTRYIHLEVWLGRITSQRTHGSA
jgi:hypothetical protein